MHGASRLSAAKGASRRGLRYAPSMRLGKRLFCSWERQTPSQGPCRGLCSSCMLGCLMLISCGLPRRRHELQQRCQRWTARCSSRVRSGGITRGGGSCRRDLRQGVGWRAENAASLSPSVRAGGRGERAGRGLRSGGGPYGLAGGSRPSSWPD